MRNCKNCQTSFEPVNANQIICSKRCKDVHKSRKYRKKNPDKRRETVRNWYQTSGGDYDREKHSEACRRWREKNRQHLREYRGYNWMYRICPTAEKVIALVEYMNDRQKGRFADWLLKVGHEVLRHHEVDHFVSDFNTQGI